LDSQKRLMLQQEKLHTWHLNINSDAVRTAVPLDEESQKKMENIELESISETIHKYMEAHEELKTLSIVCEFDKLMAEK